MMENLLLGHLVDLLAVGHEIENMLVAILQELRDIVEREPFVLWYLNPPAVLAFDALLAAVDQVLEEVHGDLLICGQVDSGVDSEEIVDFPF